MRRWFSTCERYGGLCRVVDFVEDDDGETEMVLEPVERFPEPVDVLAMKKEDPAVKALRAFRQGQVQTLYETSAQEAKTLLRICRAESCACGIFHPRGSRRSVTRMGGIGVSGRRWDSWQRGLGMRI